MKILSFVVLILVSYSSNAIELVSCTDKSGKTHFTNLPKASLDSNCSTKDHHSVLLQQDYANLDQVYAKYELEKPELLEEDDSIDLSNIDISPDSIKNKVRDVFDPDKAFDELMEATEDRDDVFTRAIRGRSETIKNITGQSKN